MSTFPLTVLVAALAVWVSACEPTEGTRQGPPASTPPAPTERRSPAAPPVSKSIPEILPLPEGQDSRFIVNSLRIVDRAKEFEALRQSIDQFRADLAGTAAKPERSTSR